MPKPDLFSVPRRFDLFTVLVAAAGFAVLFTAMRLLDFRPATMAVLAGLFAVVAFAQAVTHGRFSPRHASMDVTVIYFMILAGAEVLLYGRGNVVIGVFFSLILGLIVGYLVGVLVAGVFLVSYHLRERFNRPIENASASRQEHSPWDETEETPTSNTSVAQPSKNPTKPLAGKPS
jgi:hypothetical protein